MAYVFPNSTIRLLRGVRLDNTYQNTLYFASEADQTAYFAGQAKHSFPAQSYQRANKNSLRVQVPTDACYDCNYLMFQNTAFGNKWFYAFIISVNYINNNVTEVEYEIDVMQTWLFSFSLGFCFVEREHSATDGVGDNILPEPVGSCEYVMNSSYAPLVNFTSQAVIVAVVDVNESSDGKLYDGIYGSATLHVFKSTDVTGINDLINSYAQAADAIIGMYMLPAASMSSIPDGGAVVQQSESAWAHEVEGDSIDQYERSRTLDGYLPKNRKLYTYPYFFYHVDNANGQDMQIRYEFCEKNGTNIRPKFKVEGTITQPVQVRCTPMNYKNITGVFRNLMESVSLNNFPMCSWNVDAYQAWVAQNAVPLALKTVSGIGQTAISSVYSVNPIGTMASGLLAEAANVMSEMYTASIAADMSKGSLNNGGVNTAAKTQQFWAGLMCIPYENARSIDEFFTRFGYACKRVKVPNRSARPIWNYVKTSGCNLRPVTGHNMPAEDMRKVCLIHDSGVTYWKNPGVVGEYSGDNSVD